MGAGEVRVMTVLDWIHHKDSVLLNLSLAPGALTVIRHRHRDVTV